MCTRRTLIGGALALAFLVASPSLVSAQQTEVDSLRAVTDSLRARVQQLEARLDSLLTALARGAPVQREAREAQDELAALRAAARAAAGQTRADTSVAEPGRTRNLTALNPEISVTGDVVGSYAAAAGEDDNASATPREFEFSFQAALDPYTHTKIFVTHEQDFEIAGFPEEEGEEETGNGNVEIEEGYMYWVGLPASLGLKLGRFRQEFGLYNRWHTHALMEVERPLAAQIFLGEDGLIQSGGSITLPTLGFGPATQTLTLELTRANNEALFDGGNQIGYLANLQSFLDLSASSYLQFGLTGVYGENDDDALISRLLGVDISYRWRPPGRGLYRDLTLKAEWYFAGKDVGPARLRGDGGYAQLNYRLGRSWILGARADYLDPFEDAPEILQLVPSVTWWQSEWVRIRLQYNLLKPQGGDSNHTILLQTVWAVGPHKHETY
jgi:hypothetical protein